MLKKSAFVLIFAVTAVAQDHSHPRNVHGVPGGVPEFCASPTVTSAGSGSWSNAATWSTKKVPGVGDRVLVAAGHNPMDLKRGIDAAVEVVVGEQVYAVEVPEDLLRESAEAHAKLDRDMDRGWKMSREFVARPDSLQRCQIAAVRLIDKLERKQVGVLEHESQPHRTPGELLQRLAAGPMDVPSERVADQLGAV